MKKVAWTVGALWLLVGCGGAELEARSEGPTGTTSTAGGLDRTSQSVECSGPYTPGGYSQYCYVNIYFNNQGQDASDNTPTWQF